MRALPVLLLLLTACNESAAPWLEAGGHKPAKRCRPPAKVAAVPVARDAGAGSCVLSLGLPLTPADGLSDFTVAELNGDGVPDVVAIDGRYSTLRTWFGDSTGRFWSGNDAGTPGAALSALARADFNGDGQLDIATRWDAAGGVAVFLGSGGGQFSAPVVTATPGFDYQFAHAAGDFNGDGRADLLTIDSTQYLLPTRFFARALVFLGRGDGSFLAPRVFDVGLSTRQVVTGDFDSDGRLDFAFGDSEGKEVKVFLGRGDGSFTLKSRLAVDFFPLSVASADIDADGALDLVVGFNGGFVLLLGGCDGTMKLARTWRLIDQSNYGSPAPTDFVLADVTGDGELDILSANGGINQTITLVPNLGAATFAEPITFNAGISPAFMELADVTGDGLNDLVVGSGSLVVLRGEPGGTFRHVPSYPPGDRQSSFRVALGDFNRDSLPDVAALNSVIPTPSSSDPSSVTVFLHTDAGTLSVASTTSLTRGAWAIEAAELTGDALPDVAVSFHGSLGGFSLLAGVAGGGVSTVETFIDAGVSFHELLAADVTSDGLTDLVATSQPLSGGGGAGLTLYVAQGDGGLTPSLIDAGTSARAAAIGDLNKDGFADLATCAVDDNGSSIALSYGSANGSFSAAQHEATSYWCAAISIADFNGDQNPDVMGTGREPRLLLGNGDGTYRSDAGTPAGTFDVSQQFARDLDGDGNVDLISAEDLHVVVRRGRGDGSFEMPLYFGSSSSLNGLAIVDFNQDGLLDVITAGGDVGVMLQERCGP